MFVAEFILCAKKLFKTFLPNTYVLSYSLIQSLVMVISGTFIASFAAASLQLIPILIGTLYNVMRFPLRLEFYQDVVYLI